jgi:general secretion pathway protein H
MRTPISTTSPPRRAEAGFTLIELLAVLAILAIAITAFSTSGTRSLDTAKLRALLVHTVATIGQARADAMRGMTETVFYIDLPNRRLSYPASGRTLDFPADLKLTVTAAQSERRKDGAIGIRFYPTGGSSGGVLDFAYRGQTYEINVNWLTGNATLARL